jgi:hypothetical protein
MNFGEILTKAWRIIWKYKILWVFGILSSCGQGGGGGGGGGNTGFQYSRGDADVPPGMREFFNNMEYFFDHIQGWQIAMMVIGLFLFFLILGLIFTALSTVGRIGLIQGTVKTHKVVDLESGERLTFGELFNRGKPFFWRIFGFNILVGLAVFLAVIVLVIFFATVAVMTLGIAMICLIPLICLLIPASWLLSVLFEQVNIAIVVEDLSITDGLRRGWEIFTENIGNLIVMGLILGIGGWLVGLILALPMIAVVVPLVVGIVGGIRTSSELWFGGGIATAALCFGLYLPALILLNGILQGYIKTAWALTYLQLTSPAEEAPAPVEVLEKEVDEPEETG